MTSCKTDEEREKVYLQVENSVRDMQEKLQQKGEKILAELKLKSDTAEKNSSAEHLKNIVDTIEIVKFAKSVNPKIKIKFNTVVSKLNFNEKLTDIEKEIPISRWKFLKMKRFKNDKFSNINLAVNDEEFFYFLQLNKLDKALNILETSLENSYVIIDNVGNFLDNTNENYKIIGNLLEEDFADIFNRYEFNSELYKSRYK